MAKQRIYLAVTPKGDTYLQQMVAVGFPNLQSTQRAEWNILNDLNLQGEQVEMGSFLTAGRDTILGRRFMELSQPAVEDYGRVLHQLIKQGYIKALKREPLP